MISPAAIVAEILLAEGASYTDRAADRGGPTKFGVTLKTLAAYRAPAPVSTADLQALGLEEARAIYTALYLEGPGLTRLNDQALAALVVDAAVQHGVATAIEMLQRAAGVRSDGQLGEISIAAINAHDPRALRALVCGARIRLYGSLIEADPALARAREAGFRCQGENALGWANRIARFVEEA